MAPPRSTNSTNCPPADAGGQLSEESAGKAAPLGRRRGAEMAFKMESQRRPRGRATKLNITDDMRAIAEEEVTKILAFMQLVHGGRRSLTGSRHLATLSKTQYSYHYNSLRDFLTLIGDWQSLVMLLENAPGPSIRADSLCSFIKWKSEELGKHIITESGNRLVNFFTHEEILSSGSWNSPVNLTQFCSAVSCLHQQRNQIGPYEEPCDNCKEAYLRNGASGCLHHLGKPRLFTQGNVTLSRSVSDCIRKGRADRTDYHAQGDSPLSPEELLRLRRLLLSENTLDAWQEYVHILFDVKLFLRDEEATDFGIGNCTFLPEITTFDNNGIASMLAGKVKGKSDKKSVHLCIWRDDDIPELCLLRHLLTYVHLAGIKEGELLFPNLDKRDSPIPYSTFNDRLKRLFPKVTGRHGPWGTHSLRKTAYLLATWCGASDLELMASARHKSHDVSLEYKKDACTLLEIARNNG
jgi:hypothetical protein